MWVAIVFLSVILFKLLRIFFCFQKDVLFETWGLITHLVSHLFTAPCFLALFSGIQTLLCTNVLATNSNDLDGGQIVCIVNKVHQHVWGCALLRNSCILLRSIIILNIYIQKYFVTSVDQCTHFALAIFLFSCILHLTTMSTSFNDSFRADQFFDQYET